MTRRLSAPISAAAALFTFCASAQAQSLELMCDFDTVLNASGPEQPNGDRDVFYVSVDQDRAAYHWGDRPNLGPFTATISDTAIGWTVPSGSDGLGAVVKIDRVSGRIVFLTTLRNEAGHGGFSGKCRPLPTTKKF